jgi:hypothetical protein
MAAPGLVQVGLGRAEYLATERQLRTVMANMKGVEKRIQKAIVTATNKTARFVQSQMAKSISKEVNIKQKDVKRYIKIDRMASVLNGVAVVVLSKSKRIQLIYFGARDTAEGGWKARTGKGVTYKIAKRGPRKRIRDAFITRANNQLMVAKRKGKSRMPLVAPLRGPSPWGVYVLSGMQKVTLQEGVARLRKELREQVRVATLRANRVIK